MTEDVTSKSQNLVAVSELKRRRREIDERLTYLEKERHALEEIRESLAGEAEHLSTRLAAANGERQQMAQKMDSRTQYAMKTLEEMDRIKRETAVFERRCQENEERERELDAQIAALERELSAAKNDMLSATDELEAGRAAIVRMNRKLSFTGGDGR